MQNRNISAPFTVTTVSIPGTVGSLISGSVIGASQSSQASEKSAQEFQSSQRDSLLKALNVLFRESNQFRDDQIPGVNLFPEALQDILAMLHKGGASTVAKLSVGALTAGSHLSQLPLDVIATIDGLIHSINDFRPFFQSKEAFILDVDREIQENKSMLSANCKALCNNIREVSQQLKRVINENYAGNGCAGESHAGLVNTFASTAMLGSLGSAGFVSFMVDMLGSTFRELSGAIAFSKLESTHPNEINIYQAFTACCHTLTHSQNSQESLLALRNLEAAILDFRPASDMCDHHSITGPSLSVFTRMLTAEPFVISLSAFNNSSLALTAALHALGNEQDNFYINTKRSATLASALQATNGGQHHSQNVSDFCHIIDAAIEHIEADLHAIADHGYIAGTAKSNIRSTAALAIMPSLITGLTGLISREFSGSVDFTRNDAGSKQESTLVSQSRPDMTGADLDLLLARISAMQERVQRCHDLGVSAPVVLGVTEAITTGALISSLNVLAGMYSALREFRTMSHSPSQATVLNEAERQKAVEYAQSVVDCNLKSAGTTGGGSCSFNISLHEKIESVMRKMVLTHRSKQNFFQPDLERNDLDSAGKSSIAFTQGNSTGFLCGSLAVMALVSLETGIGTEGLLGALRVVTQARRVSNGVDKTESQNGSKSNFSFLSNATRLSEDSINKSSITKTVSSSTYHVMESVFSRSLTVALCQSGALKAMLERLVRQEYEQLVHAPGFLDSALTSDALQPRLQMAILNVLDAADANNQRIPGLNRDMASLLSGVSNASIATALCAHSSVTTPILKSIIAAKKASIIPANLKNEALSVNSELSRIISTALNQIQAFTKGFMHEVVNIHNPMNNSSLTKSSDSLQARSLSAVSATTLLCEELFEICISRSLTLIDKEKVDQKSMALSEASRLQQQLSTHAVAEDSALDQNCSMSHVVTALRLTLSHLGASLGELASKLDSKSGLLKDNLEMHSSQQSLLNCMSSTFTAFSQAMLAISAGLSQIPLSTVGSIESLRDVFHSIDQHLILKPVHSSEKSNRECGSETTLLTAMVTDSVSSMLCTVTKLLLRAAVFGLDTTLSIAKILEILTVHPHPGDALSLELQALSQPNGSARNLHELKQNMSASTTLGAASVCAASQTGSSMSTENALRTFQAAVDVQIEKVALLEDEEENEKLGLKAFFEILARVANNAHAANADNAHHYKDLVLQFHRGGISLASYHSEHGNLFGVNNNGAKKNALIKDDHFLSCDNAANLLDTFINKAYKTEANEAHRLLDRLKLEINNLNNLSQKSKTCWEYIINKVMDRMILKSTQSSIFHPGESRVSKKKWLDRKNDLLRNVLIEPLHIEENLTVMQQEVIEDGMEAVAIITEDDLNAVDASASIHHHNDN